MNLSWFLSALPALAVAILLSVRFWSTHPQSDGELYFLYAGKTWDLPIKAENFWAGWNHRESYVSMGLLGLTYHVGLDPLTALRLLQLGLYASAILAFSTICHTVFRGIGTFEAALLTLVFSVTPAYVAYFAGVSLDFVAVTFLLVYLAALCLRCFPLAAACGIAFAFCKETSFLLYACSLPFVLVYSARRFGPVGARPNLTRAVFLLPFVFKITRHLLGDPDEIESLLSFCRQDSMAAFLFSPNLGRPQIQSYLFDLFLLNFQWLFLIPCAAGSVVLCKRLLAGHTAFGVDREQVNGAPLFLLVGFLASGLYVITRCPLWNSVKYVLQPIPVWLLVGYGLSRYALPRPFSRIAFLTVMAALLGVSTVLTLDPVSLAFFGRSDDQSRTMLCMNSRVRQPQEKSCGNDEMIYNLQAFPPRE